MKSASARKAAAAPPSAICVAADLAKLIACGHYDHVIPQGMRDKLEHSQTEFQMVCGSPYSSTYSVRRADCLLSAVFDARMDYVPEMLFSGKSVRDNIGYWVSWLNDDDRKFNISVQELIALLNSPDLPLGTKMQSFAKTDLLPALQGFLSLSKKMLDVAISEPMDRNAYCHRCCMGFLYSSEKDTIKVQVDRLFKRSYARICDVLKMLTGSANNEIIQSGCDKVESNAPSSLWPIGTPDFETGRLVEFKTDKGLANLKFIRDQIPSTIEVLLTKPQTSNVELYQNLRASTMTGRYVPIKSYFLSHPKFISKLKRIGNLDHVIEWIETQLPSATDYEEGFHVDGDVFFHDATPLAFGKRYSQMVEHIITNEEYASEVAGCYNTFGAMPNAISISLGSRLQDPVINLRAEECKNANYEAKWINAFNQYVTKMYIRLFAKDVISKVDQLFCTPEWATAESLSDILHNHTASEHHFKSKFTKDVQANLRELDMSLIEVLSLELTSPDGGGLRRGLTARKDLLKYLNKLKNTAGANILHQVVIPDLWDCIQRSTSKAIRIPSVSAHT